MQPEDLDRVGADLGVLGEDIDAVLGRQRITVAGLAQFLDRAHHAERLHAAQLTLLYLNAVLGERASVVTAGDSAAVQHHGNFRALGLADHDVRRTGNDLNGLRSDIYLADHELIRVRVLLDLLDLPDHDLLEVLIQLLVILHFRSGERHGVHELLITHVQVRYVLSDPCQRCFHLPLTS